MWFAVWVPPAHVIMLLWDERGNGHNLARAAV